MGDTVRTWLGALRTLSRDDRLEVLAFPSLLSPVTIRSLTGRSRDLFGFVDSRFFDVTTVRHIGETSHAGNFEGGSGQQEEEEVIELRMTVTAIR